MQEGSTLTPGQNFDLTAKSANISTLRLVYDAIEPGLEDIIQNSTVTIVADELIHLQAAGSIIADKVSLVSRKDILIKGTIQPPN